MSYRIYGVELSPYSVKVRAWFRYKGLTHEWIVRTRARQQEAQAYARLPLIPIVVTPEGEGLQDSTPVLERLEREHPEPSIWPGEPVSAFVSALLEEFADEWGNKWMFHLRWAREVDQHSAALRLARALEPELEGAPLDALSAQVRERMRGRVGFVGSNAQTGPQIEASFTESVALLDAHLATRPYIFGARPALADFGLWGQIYNCFTDPTPGARIGATAPHLLNWVHRMAWPRDEGAFEPWSDLEPTLLPLLESQVGGLFLPWSCANAEAIEAGKDSLRVELRGQTWTQIPQKYHARSLAALRARYAATRDAEGLDAVLRRAGCLEALRDERTA